MRCLPVLAELIDGGNCEVADRHSSQQAGAGSAALAAHQHEVKDIGGYKQGQQTLPKILTESFYGIKEPKQQSAEQQQPHNDL